MKKDDLKLAGAILIISLLAAGCGASKTEPAPAKQEEQAQVAEAPAAEEPIAEEPVAEEALEPATTEVMPAPESDGQQSEPQNEPEEEAIPEGSEINESELEDGTKSTEIIKPDGSIRLVLEAPDGSRTETDYDPQLYPQSKVVYDENGRKTSESTFRYDEDQLDTSWESATSYDENGNVEFTSETEILYPEDEGFMYGSDIEPKKTVTVVTDAQGEYVKTITYKNKYNQETTIEFADGSKEIHYIVATIYKGTSSDSEGVSYYRPYEDKKYKDVIQRQDGSRKVLEITEVLGYEDGSIHLSPLFKYQEHGQEEISAGKRQGLLEWTGNRLKNRGKGIYSGIFEEVF